MPGGWQWTSRKWNGLRDCLRQIIRRMTGDKRSSMPATPSGNSLITDENGLSGWRTTRVGQHSTAKTRVKIIDCRTVPRDRHSGARVPRSFSAPRRSAAVVSKFCRRDSNLMVEIDSAHRHSLCHYAFTTRMIDQEIMYLRVRTIVCVDNATASERSKALVIGLIYQRTVSTFILLPVFVFVQNLRTVGKVDIAI